MPTFVALPGSQKNLLPNSRAAGAVDLSEVVNITVRLRSTGKPEDLVKKAYELAVTPMDQRKYLTHEDLARHHGASQDDLDKIEHYAQRHDLVVVHRSGAERCVVLQGPLGRLLNAFQANVQIYHHASGTYRGRVGEIGIPQELGGIITGVFGFDTRRKHRAPFRQKRASQLAQADSKGPGNGNGVSATVFASRYAFPTAQGSTALDGTGQTIAIIELGGGFRNSDLKAFFTEVGSPSPSVSAVQVDHARNAPSTPNSDDGEVMLDIEVAGAVVPKAKFAVYFAPNNGDKGFLDAISAAVHDVQRKPSVISISWGGPESSSDQQGIQAFHELFAAAATLGITICVASGDHGTADLDARHWDQGIHVDHPSCDDLVLSCGGTQIEKGKDVVWNDGTPFNINTQGGGGWASGGGISEVFPVPKYQEGANKVLSLKTQQQGRGVPDIAMSATDYFTRVDSAEGPSGGTSAVAPLMAALVARLNQAKRKNVGFLNPFLYANAASGVVTDVTSGTNAIQGTVEGYTATVGWDPCTGLGTPVGTEILKKLP